MTGMPPERPQGWPCSCCSGPCCSREACPSSQASRCPLPSDLINPASQETAGPDGRRQRSPGQTPLRRKDQLAPGPPCSFPTAQRQRELPPSLRAPNMKQGAWRCPGARTQRLSTPRARRGPRPHSMHSGGAGGTYHVHTTPDLVSARENWAPHSIWHTPCPFSLSMFWGTLQPSLPPRPNFPKSPSPQENTKPGGGRGLQPGSGSHPQGERGRLTFVGQSQGLRVSAPTGDLDHSVPQEHFHLRDRGQSHARRESEGDLPRRQHTLPEAGRWRASPRHQVGAHHLGLQLRRVVPMPQPAVLPEAPGVQLAAGCEGCAVRAPAGDVPDALGLQGLDQPRLVTVPGANEQRALTNPACV